MSFAAAITGLEFARQRRRGWSLARQAAERAAVIRRSAIAPVDREPPRRDVAARWAELNAVLPDRRDLTGVICGDPLFGDYRRSYGRDYSPSGDMGWRKS